MNGWLEIEAFSELVKLDISTILEMIEEGKLVSKEENGVRFVEANRHAIALMPSSKNLTTDAAKAFSVNSEFLEKTVGTILALHEKVVEAKEQTVEVLKGENHFLKEALFSMQEHYEEDRKTIETLTKQIELLSDELDFTKRKYKMMWNKAVENYTPPTK